MTPDEWLNKADYEGGILSGLEYGLTEDDIDAAAHPEFHAQVVAIRAVFVVLRRMIDQLPASFEVDAE
ncbi:hypothetical protein J2Y69_003372 [Microbacterium resistens]|uniref:Uncharacterized protein n=1 Tax=Microbacterium resistens TaxID=156977 RepID=A0ABU1SIA7_9MICO|nr:hypothetical protein [Microbacterium resistens]MDR6868748.1 hypothetical protein [Microbacterium resistens]